jgi:hypothetical protein
MTTDAFSPQKPNESPTSPTATDFPNIQYKYLCATLKEVLVRLLEKS